MFTQVYRGLKLKERNITTHKILEYHFYPTSTFMNFNKIPKDYVHNLINV